MEYIGVITATLVLLLISASCKPYGTLNSVVPSETGYNINWGLQNQNNCQWCELLFNHLVKDLTDGYNPSIVNTLADNELNAIVPGNFKVSRLINWIVSNDYSTLSGVLGSKKYKGYNKWFIFVNAAAKELFFQAFDQAIDADFGNQYPRTVAILLDLHSFSFSDNLKLNRANGSSEISIEIAIPCYLCPDVKTYFIQNDGDNQNPWKGLKDAKAKQGYGASVTTFDDDPFAHGNVIIEAYFQKLEEAFFRSWRPHPASPREAILFVVGAAFVHLNLTYTAHRSISNYPGLIACLGCVRAPVEVVNIDAVSLATEASSLTYCRKENSKYTNVLAAFFAAYDGCTWSLMLASCVILWFVPSIGWQVIAIMFSILAQGVSIKRHGWVIAGNIIILIPMQAVLVTFFTLNAVVPFEENFIDTNQDLFDAGFKIVVQGDMATKLYSELYVETFNNSFAGLLLNRQNIEQYFTNAVKVYMAPSNILLRQARGFGTISLKRKVGIHFMTLAEVGSFDTKCHMLKELWHVRTTTLYFKGHIAEKTSYTFKQLLSAGYGEFWESSQASAQIRRSFKLSTRKIDSMEEEMKLMNASLIIALRVYFFLSLLNVGIFVIEFVRGKRLISEFCRSLNTAFFISCSEIMKWWALFKFSCRLTQTRPKSE